MSGARVLPLSRRDYLWVEGNSLTEPIMSYRTFCEERWSQFERWYACYCEAKAREQRLTANVIHFGRGASAPRPLPRRPAALPASIALQLWGLFWLGILAMGGWV